MARPRGAERHANQAASTPGRGRAMQKHREELSPLLRTMPSRRDGRPTPPTGRLRCRSAREDWSLLGKDRWRRPFLISLQTAPNGRASRRHPLRREVPLGTRRLEFAQTSPRAATRFWTKTASGHHISQPNELWPRAWAEFSPWRPVASPRDGSATFAPLICARAGDGPKNRSTQWSLAARLGKSFPINSPFIGLISLLRRGARGLRKLPCAGGGPYAGRAVPPGTRYGPFGRENILCPRAWGNSSVSTLR